MRRWWLLLLVIAVLIAGLGTVLMVQQRSEKGPGASVLTAPTPVPARTPILTASTDSALLPTRTGLVRTLQTALDHPLLRGKVSLSIVDAETGQPLLELDADRPTVPASTAKIATALAALSVLPGDRRLVTRVLSGAPGDVVLVGGGDPTLVAPGERSGYPGAPKLADLAAQLAKLQPPVRRVLVDDRLFTGPRLGPGWKPSYVTSADVAPVSSLELYGEEPPDSALNTGNRLAALLGVTTPVVRGVAPAGARELARVSSLPVADLVEIVLATSDNDLAEALGRHIAIAERRPATFDGAAGASQAALQPLLRQVGVGPQGIALRDASGLSVLNRVQPGALARLLALATRDDRYASLLSGLPVAGFDGTLSERYREGPTMAAAGQVRAKTGTLTGVSALAGLVRTASGRLLAFDVTANGLPEFGSRKAAAALDAVAAALASCGCA